MRSNVNAGTALGSAFLFSFESEGKSVAQFVVMSVAGFVATAAFVGFFYLGLPEEYLATRVARGGALFLVFLGVTFEVALLSYGLITRFVPKQVVV